MTTQQVIATQQTQVMATEQTQVLGRALLSPAVVLLFIWMIVPLAMTIYFSTLHYTLMDTENWSFVGLENFRYFLTDPAFLTSLRNTLVLVGSVRDDGPLPDVFTDVVAGQRAMRAQLADVGFCIVVATMLHGIATGNILPASIPLVCVDINPATVTKLADRGSAHAIGIVTDIGLFFEQLARELAPSYGAATT